jgi:hypothetical protein
MIIKLASPYQDASGKHGGTGGTVTYKSGGRQQARSMVVPANPQSTYQTAMRSIAAASAQAFQLLTPAEKSDWQTLANSMIRSGRLGLPYTFSAINAYCCVNNYRQIAAQAISDTAPAFVSRSALSLTSAVYDISNAEITITGTNANTENTAFYAFRFTNPTPSAVCLARENGLRYFTSTPQNNIVTCGTVGTQDYSLSPALSYWDAPAATCVFGIEVVSLSADYVPGSRVWLDAATLTVQA